MTQKWTSEIHGYLYLYGLNFISIPSYPKLIGINISRYL